MTDRLDAIRQKAEAHGYDTKGDGDDVRFLLAEIDAASATLDELAAPDPTKPLPQRIRDEIADFQMVIGHCSEIYDNISGGLVSKPTTLPSVVLQLASDRTQALIEEATKDIAAERDEALAMRDAIAEAKAPASAEVVGQAEMRAATAEAERDAALQRLTEMEAERDKLKAEIAEASDILSPGALVDGPTGTPIPTSLIERAQYTVMALDSEDDRILELKAELDTLRAQGRCRTIY